MLIDLELQAIDVGNDKVRITATIRDVNGNAIRTYTGIERHITKAMSAVARWYIIQKRHLERPDIYPDGAPVWDGQLGLPGFDEAPF